MDLLFLIYHSTVRDVRKAHGNPVAGLVINIVQAFVMVMVFFIFFSVLGLRGSAIRGDFMLYIMSGIFLFMTHTKAMSAVVRSEGPTSPMMKHAPMNTIVAITSSALAALYLQVLSMFLLLTIYHFGFNRIEIYQPAGAFAMLLLAWLSGVAVGMVFLAMKPWFPSAVSLLSMIYARANMVASGKMFVANTMPTAILALFDWNPLFHAIDQARGFIFINYFPHYSSIGYPIKVSLALVMLGLMGEFYTRKKSSLSWSAAR